MNVASITLYISQITFGLIFIFAFISFLIYKIKGRGYEKEFVKPDYRHYQQEIPIREHEIYDVNPNVLSYTVETVPNTQNVRIAESFSGMSLNDVRYRPVFNENRSRFTVMKSDMEGSINRSPVMNNWS
jgi:hypothetical protein